LRIIVGKLRTVWDEGLKNWLTFGNLYR
jgi:hypothetical protein